MDNPLPHEVGPDDIGEVLGEVRIVGTGQPIGEYLPSILRKQVGGKQLLRVYFGAGDMLFPPKQYYGLDEVKVDVAAGWEWVTMMHDHTVRKHGDLPALGVTTLSTSDVQLVRNLVEDGLRGARVTWRAFAGG